MAMTLGGVVQVWARIVEMPILLLSMYFIDRVYNVENVLKYFKQPSGQWHQRNARACGITEAAAWKAR